MINPFDDEYFMREAIKEAVLAGEEDEVPVGAVIVFKDRIIGRGHNRTERLNDVTAHAEMQAITAAAEALGSKYLVNCTLYVTLEPCVMCAGALYWSQISKVIYAASDDKRGASRLGRPYHPKTIVESGIFAEESVGLIRDFFARKRNT